jgi:hypothetical protein
MTPGMSRPELLRAPSGSRMTRIAPTVATAAKGMLTKKVQRQSRYSVSTPPRIRPTAPPPPAMAP